MGVKSLSQLQDSYRSCFKGRADPTASVIYEFVEPRVIKKTRLAKLGNWLSHFEIPTVEVRAVS